MTGDLIESYVHKLVERRRTDVSLRFLTSQSLFSSNTIDPGTNLLLRTVGAHADRSFERCLDLGCGYGPIGASLAASGLAQLVDMVDRDALAVELARRNVELNQLSNVNVLPSLGYDDVHDTRYDLIVSNLPGKAGEHVLRYLLKAAAGCITDDGQVWVVVVTPLRPLVEQVIADSGARVIHAEHGTRHSVYGFVPTSLPDNSDRDSIAAGIYRRGSVEFLVGGRRYGIETSRGVDEFDGLSYSTKLLLEQLYSVRNRKVKRAALFNVSQGFIPVAVRASAIADHVDLVDRDLLALRTTSRNLIGNNLSDSKTVTHHEVAWVPPGDTTFGLICGRFRGDEPPAAIEGGVATVSDRLELGGYGVIAGGSTAITRMHKSMGWRKDIEVIERQRYRGASVVTFVKKS